MSKKAVPPVIAALDAAIATVVSPSINSPDSPLDVQVTGETPVRFTYVPGEGLYAGDAKEWSLARERTPASDVLRKTPKLGDFLTRNPLSVVYGRYGAGGLLLTAIYAGGIFIKEEEARKMTPHLRWAE